MTDDKILLYIGRGRGLVLDHAALGIDARDFVHEPKVSARRARRRPVYQTFAIRRSGPVDEKAAEAVLDWLSSGCSIP